MAVVGGRWKFIILYTLRNAPRRFGQINQFIPSISKKVLTEQLRELEEDGIISRTVGGQQSQVTVAYSLTEKGQQLIPIINLMAQWGEANPSTT